MAAYGHQGGGWMNADQRSAIEDMAKSKQPDKPGFYWARWLTAAPGTHEGDELTPAPAWDVVEVWVNHIGTECEADKQHGIEKFGVAVPGVRETQWLDNFRWDVGPSGRPEPIPEPGCEQ